MKLTTEFRDIDIESADAWDAMTTLEQKEYIKELVDRDKLYSAQLLEEPDDVPVEV